MTLSLGYRLSACAGEMGWPVPNMMEDRLEAATATDLVPRHRPRRMPSLAPTSCAPQNDSAGTKHLHHSRAFCFRIMHGIDNATERERERERVGHRHLDYPPGI